MKVAIIGAGNMGGAIACGLAKGNIIPTGDIIVSDPSPDKLEALKKEFPVIQTTHNNREATREAEMVILAVKPWLAGSVLHEIGLRENQTLVSIVAGISFNQLSEMTGLSAITMFRLIPNTAISRLQSMTVIASRNASPRQEQQILDIFNEMGLAMLLPEEKMSAATAMTSCGIAYVLKYIQAAMQAGIELGIYPKDGMKMVAQSVKGAAELILAGDTHPSVEIDKVCTPGGITIKGINELEHNGFSSTVIKAIKASHVQ